MKTSRILRCLFLILAAVFVGSASAAETYAADPAHSSVEFRISHFFSKVSGRFGRFSATLTVDRENMEHSFVKAEIETASVDTNQEKRDTRLRSADFFDVVKFPKMTFESKDWKRTGANEFDVTGDLTLHGVTRPVVLKVRSLGFGEGMNKTFISGWEARARIQRSDFGLTKGGPAVGEEVEIEINIEAKKL